VPIEKDMITWCGSLSRTFVRCCVSELFKHEIADLNEEDELLSAVDTVHTQDSSYRGALSSESLVGIVYHAMALEVIRGETMSRSPESNP